MLEYNTEIHIDAPPSNVWKVLVDTPAWPQWDPFCERIEADDGLALGAKVKAFTKLSPGRGFSLKVTTFEPGEMMVWTGGMPLGLFKGQRTYGLSSTGRGTRFTMREVFTGPMLKLIAGSIPDMNEAFRAFAQGLKDRAEHPAAQTDTSRPVN